MRNTLVGIVASFVVLASFVFLEARGIAQDAIRHSLFIAGPEFTGVLNEDGTVQWTLDVPVVETVLCSTMGIS